MSKLNGRIQRLEAQAPGAGDDVEIVKVVKHGDGDGDVLRIIEYKDEPEE